MFLKVDPSQRYAYVFADSFVLSFDIRTMTIVEHKNISALTIRSNFRVHAVDITDTYAILVGFDDVPPRSYLSLQTAILIALNPLKIQGETYIHHLPQPITGTLSYNRINDMSVAINPTRDMAIIGVPGINKVVLLSISTASSVDESWSLDIIRSDIGPRHCIGFGRSVVWIDDATVAIAILTVPNRPWSQSEVWIYTLDRPFELPLFVFPNNQQNVIYTSSPSFLHIISWSGNLLVVTDQIHALFVPSQSAGSFSVGGIDEYFHFFIFTSSPCVAGTYKNTSGFGPCTVCPPQTKNTGNQPCTKCAPCAFTSFCPLGSVNDISLYSYPSYTQTFSYPDPPDMNNYDDLLVQNVFTIGHSRHCIVIAPLFWTIIVITLCLIVWFLMALPKICNCRRGHPHRSRAKQFLKKVDIVNQGERWVGGLFSFAIVLLISFTLWFATEFLKLYPIETSSISYVSCDDTIRNAVFSSALQLPLPNPDGHQWAIFEMLDTQNLTITVDLLNTLANCSNITVQQNRPGVNYLRLPIISCVLRSDNATRSVSFLLPAHDTSIKVNVTGPFFVGGMRVCLHGASHIVDVNTLETLDMCQLFSTMNETLSRTTTLHILLTKVINITKPLEVDGDTHYNGRWALHFAARFLSDELIYQQDGHHLRYITEGTILEFTLSEQPFYIQNIQEPIVRRAELAFHTLLFCTLIIELFGMGFLICRLAIMPLIHAAILRCRRFNERSNNMVKAPPSLSISIF